MPRRPIPENIKFLVGGIKLYHGAPNRNLYEKIQAVMGKAAWDEVDFHFNRVSEFLTDPSTTVMLDWALAESARPFLGHAGDWLIDVTGLQTTTRSLHRIEHYGRQEDHVRDEWIKLHLICERKYGIAPAAIITRSSGDETSDTSQLSNLVDRVASQGFEIRSVSADKAYASESNLATIQKHGGTPYIPLKNIYNETRLPKTPLMRNLYHRIQLQEEEFHDNYRLRPFIESWFAALKTKFGSLVRGHTFQTQQNEALYMVLCHNLSILSRAIIEHKIDVTGYLGDVG